MRISDWSSDVCSSDLRREVEMSEMRVLKRVVVLLAAWTSLVLGVSTALDDGASTPAQEPPAAVSGSSEPGTARPMPSAPPKPATTASAAQQSTSADDPDTLQQDALMTQRMAAPNAAGPMITAQLHRPEGRRVGKE